MRLVGAEPGLLRRFYGVHQGRHRPFGQRTEIFLRHAPGVVVLQVLPPFEIADAVHWVIRARNVPSADVLGAGGQTQRFRGAGIDPIEPGGQSFGRQAGSLLPRG